MMEILKVKLFKKKKAKDNYVEPIKPEPKVLKVFKNYRLVETFSKVYNNYSNKQKVIGYISKLILEQKLENAMNEPFYKSAFHEDYIIDSPYFKIDHSQQDSSYGIYKLMFDFLRELHETK